MKANLFIRRTGFAELIDLRYLPGNTNKKKDGEMSIL